MYLEVTLLLLIAGLANGHNYRDVILQRSPSSCQIFIEMCQSACRQDHRAVCNRMPTDANAMCSCNDWRGLYNEQWLESPLTSYIKNQAGSDCTRFNSMCEQHCGGQITSHYCDCVDKRWGWGTHCQCSQAGVGGGGWGAGGGGGFQPGLAQGGFQGGGQFVPPLVVGNAVPVGGGMGMGGQIGPGITIDCPPEGGGGYGCPTPMDGFGGGGMGGFPPPAPVGWGPQICGASSLTSGVILVLFPALLKLITRM